MVEISTTLAEISRNTFNPRDLSRFTMVVPGNFNLSDLLLEATAYLKSNKNGDHSQSVNCFYGEGPATGKIAFLYPGQGSQYIHMGRDLISYFAKTELLIAECINEIEVLFDHGTPLGSFIFPKIPESGKEKNELETRLRQTAVAQPAIGITSLVLTKLLSRFRVFPDVAAGHSFGELSALCAGKRISERDFLYLSICRGRLMAAACGADSGQMLAVKAHPEKIEELVKENGIEVVLANRNSPDQGVLSGSTGEIGKIFEICRKNKIRAMLLPVSAAFHSRLVSNAADGFGEQLEKVTFTPESIPVYSNQTALPYPASGTQARKVLARHLTSPVNFIDQIMNMHSSGVSVFIEVGPKNALTGLVHAILKGSSFHSFSVDASSGRQSGLNDFAIVLARLSACGYPVDLEKWKLETQ